MNPQLLITIYKIASWIIEQLIQRRAESTPQAKAQKIQKQRASTVGSLIGTLMFFIGTLVTAMFMCVDFVFAQKQNPRT